MDDISFDPNLIDCFLNGEGDYDFLISMLRNLTQDEIETLVQKIGDTFNHHVGDADTMPMLTLKRILQILHVAKTVDVPFTWEQYQAILEPFMHLCASITNIDMLKVVYLALNEHLEHPTFLQVIMNDDALRPSIAQMGKQLLTVGGMTYVKASEFVCMNEDLGVSVMFNTTQELLENMKEEEKSDEEMEAKECVEQ